MTCIIDSEGEDEIRKITRLFCENAFLLLLDIFLDDHLYVPLLSRLERPNVGGPAVVLQGGQTAPGLDHGPPLVSPRLPVQVIVQTTSFRLKI